MVSSGDDVSVLEGVSLTHEAISTSAAVPLSGMREEVSRCVSSDLVELDTRISSADSHARDFLVREDAQRNSTHNLGP